MVADASGNILARYGYDAYGSLLGVQAGVINPPATRVLYAGQLFDLQLQQYYLRARYYYPNTGRFTQQDPFGGYLRNPLTLHRYIYAGDSPVTFSDPSGRDYSLAEIMVGIGIGSNLVSMFFHIYSASVKWSRGDRYGAAADEFWAMVDLAFFFVPFLGPAARGGGFAAQFAFEGVSGADVITGAEGLWAAGVDASAVWGYLDTYAMAAQNSGTGGVMPEAGPPRVRRGRGPSPRDLEAI